MKGYETVVYRDVEGEEVAKQKGSIYIGKSSLIQKAYLRPNDSRLTHLVSRITMSFIGMLPLANRDSLH